MPLTQESRFQLLRLLDEEYQRLNQIHSSLAPNGSDIMEKQWVRYQFKFGTTKENIKFAVGMSVVTIT